MITRGAKGEVDIAACDRRHDQNIKRMGTISENLSLWIDTALDRWISRTAGGGSGRSRGRRLRLRLSLKVK